MRYSWPAALVLALAACGTQPEARRTKPAPAPVRIVHFYASAPEVAAGQAVTICYGVENARAVRLDPPAEPLKPLFNRCFSVSPKRTTTYTLTAEGPDGRTASASFTVRVRTSGASREPPREAEGMIRLFAASAEAVRPGETVTLCYGVAGAVSVRVEPYSLPLAPAEKYCFLVKPAATTTYVLTATAADGRREQAQLIVQVRQ
jgi:hypothetical protein